jgi:hypothetical protein
MDKQDIDDYHYVMEDMTMLPDITTLHLNVLANGHAFGTSAFHVLRVCSSAYPNLLGTKGYDVVVVVGCVLVSKS